MSQQHAPSTPLTTPSTLALPSVRKLSRRAFSGAALMAVVSPATTVRAQGKGERSKVTLGVAGKASLPYLPLTISEQLGYFKAEGVDVDIVDLGDGERALQSMMGGAVQVGSGPFEHTIAAQTRRQMLQAFVLQGRTPQLALGVSIKTMPNYRHPRDLKGRRIGVAGSGTSGTMVTHVVLARAGLRPGDATLVSVGSAAAALQALRSGQIDAISHTDPVMTMLEQKGEVRIISDTRTLKGTLDVFGGSMPAACLYAPLDFVEKNPETCQALANAVVHGLKWLQTAGPGDIIKTVPEAYLLGDRGLYLASFNKVRESISTDGLIPEDGPRTALRALASMDASLRAEKIDLSKTFTNEFARRAKERFKA